MRSSTSSARRRATARLRVAERNEGFLTADAASRRRSREDPLAIRTEANGIKDEIGTR